MLKKNKLVVNCDVCDTRKMKQEDYSDYENIIINSDIVIVSERSKSALNSLSVNLNNDCMIELPENINVTVKVVNGSDEITEKSVCKENTVLVVNGYLKIEPKTEEILKNYVQIVINGTVEYPKGLDGYLNKMVINGSAVTYPDDCIVLEEKFVIDKYFPMRAKQGSRYFARKAVIVSDESVDIEELLKRQAGFVTESFVVMESMAEACIPMLDEKVEIIAVPQGMKLLYGDTVLNEELINKNGSGLFVYGDVEFDGEADADSICKKIEKLIVKGKVKLNKHQEKAFTCTEAEYDEIEICRCGRKMSNMIKVKLDKLLFDNSPDGIEVCNVAEVVIGSDVPADIILEKLSLMNCARVVCQEEQESAVTAVGTNIASIGRETAGRIANDIFGALKGLADTKLVNTEKYLM